MKHLILAAVLLPSLLIAQSPQPIPVRRQLPASQVSGDVLDDNYKVSLTITDMDGPPVEVAVVVASTQFTASLGEQGITFSGTVTIEDSGSVIVAYALGWETLVAGANSTQVRTSATQGSVRLKLGEEVQIIRAGARTARLSVGKLDASEPN